jgi:hypothetical protein
LNRKKHKKSGNEPPRGKLEPKVRRTFGSMGITPALSNKPKIKAKIPAPVILNFVLLFLMLVFYMPANLFISVVVITRGLGTGVHAGSMAIMCTMQPVLRCLSLSVSCIKHSRSSLRSSFYCRLLSG